MRHAVRADSHRLLSASRCRREDLARYLCAVGVHCVPSHDRGLHSARLVRHSTHWYAILYQLAIDSKRGKKIQRKDKTKKSDK